MKITGLMWIQSVAILRISLMKLIIEYPVKLMAMNTEIQGVRNKAIIGQKISQFKSVVRDIQRNPKSGKRSRKIGSKA